MVYVSRGCVICCKRRKTIERPSVQICPSVPSIDSSGDQRVYAAEVERAQQISIVAAATARHAGRVNFDPNIRRSDIILAV